MLLPPGSWKLTSCLSDFVFLGPGSAPPRPGDEGPGSRPPLSQLHLSHTLILAGPCLFLLAWVKGPSVRLAICLVLWKGLGAVSRGHEGEGQAWPLNGVVNVQRAGPGGGVWALALIDPEIPFCPKK